MRREEGGVTTTTTPDFPPSLADMKRDACEEAGTAFDEAERREKPGAAPPLTVEHLSRVERKNKNIQKPLGVLIKASKSVCMEGGWGGVDVAREKRRGNTHTFNLLLPAAETRL